MGLSRPTAAHKKCHVSPCMGQSAMDLHWPMKHTTSCHTRLLYVHIWAARMAVAKCWDGCQEMLAMAHAFNELPLPMGLSWPTAAYNKCHVSPCMGQLAAGSHWPIEHTTSFHVRLPCGPIWAAGMAARKCSQWPMLLMNCLYQWALSQPPAACKKCCLSPHLGQLAIGSHWPIEHTMSSCMRLPCGPTWAARMAAPKMLVPAHVFNELPLTDRLELANSGL